MSGIPLQDLKHGNATTEITMFPDGEAGETVDPVTAEKLGTNYDQKDMHRMGKLQELRVSLLRWFLSSVVSLQALTPYSAQLPLYLYCRLCCNLGGYLSICVKVRLGAYRRGHLIANQRSGQHRRSFPHERRYRWRNLDVFDRLHRNGYLHAFYG